MPQNLIRLKQLNESEISGFILNTTSNAVLTGFFLDILVNRTTNQLVSGLKTFVSGINLDQIDSFSISGVNVNIISGDVTSDANIYSNNLVYRTGLFANNQYIDGEKYFQSGIYAKNLVYNTGDQTISGVKTFGNSGVFSLSGALPLGLPNNPLAVVGSGNTYLQINIQNRATGTTATADLVITANNGTDTSNYINLGINNSGYNDPTFSNGSGLDGYLFINGGSLDIGTQTPNTNVEFHIGGTTSNNSILKVTSSGIDLNTGCNIYGANNYQRTTVDFATTAAPSTRLSFNLEASKVYELDQYFRFSAGVANSHSQITTSPAASIFTDGYKMGINNQTLFTGLSGVFVGDNNNSTAGQGMMGDLSGMAHHFRKGILRPNQNATINFLAGSHNGVSTTLGQSSYVIIKKLT